jgi:hypothetical protein
VQQLDCWWFKVITTGNGQNGFYLNLTDAITTCFKYIWNNTTATSSYIYIGDSGFAVNGSGQN